MLDPLFMVVAGPAVNAPSLGLLDPPTGEYTRWAPHMSLSEGGRMRHSDEWVLTHHTHTRTRTTHMHCQREEGLVDEAVQEWVLPPPPQTARPA